MRVVYASICVWALIFCGITSCGAQTSDTGEVYSGCTPGDKEIRDMLAISDHGTVDFIRWHVQLMGEGRYTMEISYGESRPNTLALKPDSVRRKISGSYQIEKAEAPAAFREVVHLKNDQEGVELRFARVSGNLFHILTAGQQFMVGNGGWSYQLNRKMPIKDQEIFIRTRPADDTSRHMVFDGRTPCRQIRDDHPEMKKNDACFKLKWRLILDRDPVTRLPATYSLRKVIDNEPRDVKGKWGVRKGTGMLEGIVIYTLDPDQPEISMSFLAMDDNVLIFLDKQMRPYLGNEHFSVALNRRK